MYLPTLRQGLELEGVCQYQTVHRYHVQRRRFTPIIPSALRQRACHVKLLIADGRVGIQGSGNQDTRSWYHSQETNVMIDSEATCSRWREGIERNKNTGTYGKGSPEDGAWRDDQGRETTSKSDGTCLAGTTPGQGV
jgi:phosphatidylserine/phosphatidylglycerophosphate/cardiolipin synthase-like enzyme